MSGYTKLSSDLVTSTIWRESAQTRVVWITMLALADQHGEVRASIPGLADAARVSIAECEDALKLFMEPDKYSRTTDFEGRRIEAIDGGWQLLNHKKYRHLYSSDERREKTRERVQRWREKTGPSRADLDAKIADQGDCDCCGRPFEEPYGKYVVQDHNHDTGQMRGLICQSCNKNVGLVERNKTILKDPTIYVEYVRKWSDVTDCNRSNNKQKQKQKQKQVPQLPCPLDPLFDTAWGAYPRRPNNSRAAAQKAWGARIREGCDPALMLDGVQKYAAYVVASGTEARFVKMASTFFGPGRHWESDYTVSEKVDAELEAIAAEARPEAYLNADAARVWMERRAGSGSFGVRSGLESASTAQDGASAGTLL